MSTTCTRWTTPSLWKYLKTCTIIFILFATVSINAQQANLLVNQRTPWVDGTFAVTHDDSQTGLSFWTSPGNVEDANLSNVAIANILVTGSATMNVSDNNPANVYSAGNFAGFRVQSSDFSLGLLSGITVRTRLNGTLQESKNDFTLVGLSAGFAAGVFDLGFITTEDYNEIEITFSSVIGLGDYNVYYAVMERYEAGPGLDCNVQTDMNKPAFPMTIDYDNTGSGGVSIGNVDTPEDAISASTTDYASLTNILNVAGSTFIAVRDQVTDYPSGTFVGFDIENFNVVGVNLLGNITITSFLNGSPQQTISGNNLLLNGTLLNSGRQIVGFVTSTAVDEVQISLNQTGVNLGVTRVYNAVFQEFCAGPALVCNTPAALSAPPHPLYIDGEETGFDGIACVGCSIENAQFAIDQNLTNAAEIDILLGVGDNASLAVKNQITNYDAGTFAGFHIENPELVGVDALTGITISIYRDGVFKQSKTAANGLATVGTDLLTNDGEQYVGFVADSSFDEVKITLTNTASVQLGTTLVYGLIVEDFCPATVACNTNYFWTNPVFPVYVDAFLTGPNGLVSIDCDVSNSQNVLTASNSDYATITTVAQVGASASLAVADALYTYPQGTFAGFVIEDVALLLEAELFQSLTISTYNNGVFQESESAGDLLDLALLILFIDDEPGRYNVGFQATLPFDEIRITVGALVSAVNVIRVYGAFVDTRASNGGTLLCNDAPVAIDDNATTDEDEAVIISVLNNDSDSDNILGAPQPLTTPAHGSIQVNGNNTITYTPSNNFVGTDVFTYRICDNGPLCDDATVTITVNPVTDTLMQNIPEDGTASWCANSLTTYTSPATAINTCNTPANGDVSISADCIMYSPDPNYSGPDVLCIYSCHPTIPSLCDTTRIFLTVQGANDPPVANNDNVTINEDTEVIISVLANDTDPDNVPDDPQVNDQPLHGDVVVNGNNTITYTPDPDFVGVDSFTYIICDNGPLCDEATVIINVEPVTDILPVNIPEEGSFTECANDLTTYSVAATSLTQCGGGIHGDVSIVNGCVTYTADTGYEGTDMLCVYSCHPTDPTLCDTTRFMISISSVNDAPVAVDDAASTPEDMPVNIDVLANDSDPDDFLGIPQVTNQPDNGTLTFNPADSSFTYTPDPDFNGTDVFTYQICDDGLPPLCDQANVTITVSPVADTVACNVKIPFVLNTYPVSEDHNASGLACWENDFLCTPGDDDPENVINSNLSDYATGHITGLGSLELSVTDNTNTYPAGYFAGFVISSGLFNLGIFNTITVRTYLDNALRETKVVGNLAELSAGFLAGTFEVGFVTTMTFDEIEIEFDNLVAVGSYNVHYAIIERYCAGPALVCNEETRMNKPVYPVTIDYDLTGSDGVSVGTVDNPEGAVSPGTTDYASLISVVSALGGTFLTVEEQVTDYPAGTFVGFDIENLTLVSADVLNYVKITSYHNDVEQEEVTGTALLAGVPLLSGSGRHTVGFVTSTPVDKVTITVEQPVGVSLGTTRVYGAIFRKMCAGPALPCNTLSALTSPTYPVLIDGEHTGLSGGACVGCNVIETGNVIDDDAATYGQIIITAGALGSGSISVKDHLTDYPANTFAGFRIENPALVDVDALTGITVTTYLNGVEQESETNVGALVSVESNLLGNEDQQVVGFVTTQAFDEVQISLVNVGAVEVGTTRVFEMIAERFCPAEIECDTTYYLTTPTFPVYIDALLTGVDGVACVGCSVEDEQNVITATNTDYATIQIALNAVGSASIAVADALYTYPAGTFAGFVIEDPAFIVEAELFESLTISTYNNGEFVESRTGADLIDLGVLILFISADEGRYNVGFRTTEAFDEIRITTGSLATAINLIRVYSAFVDTDVSEGGELICNAPPVAVIDYAETQEDINVVIDVLDNDTDPDSEVGPPVVTNEPDHGTATENPNGTITYDPANNFVGQDTLIYQICDDSNTPQCDTALVVITVNPVNDTIEYTIPQDSNYTACANDLTIFTEPATSISICRLPENGTLTILGDCVLYDPENDFVGNDTFCVYTCHPDDPTLCDTTYVIITVTPANDPPVANPDEAETNINTPVTIHVHANDSDPDSALGTPIIDDQPNHGTVVVNPDNTITYTPANGFAGMDTLVYEICDNGVPALCDTALVTIRVVPPRDTIIQPLPPDSMFSACVSELTELDNPETMTICMAPEDGDVVVTDTCFEYTPDPGFEGTDTVCVVICDPNDICDTTIIVILVECGELTVKVFLEGPYNPSTNTMTTHLNVNHLLPGQDHLLGPSPFASTFGASYPPGQPYDTGPWNYFGTEGDAYGDPTTNPGSVPYAADITDWVLISVRQGDSAVVSEIYKCAALLHSNGVVEIPAGCGCLDLSAEGPYYILVMHRNHLPIMSNAIYPNLNTLAMDFTLQNSWVGTLFGNPFGVGQKQVEPGIWAMYAGNGRTNPILEEYDINSADFTNWNNNQNIILHYNSADHNLDADVNSVDNTIWRINFNNVTLIPR